MTFTIENDTTFFSVVWPSVADTQPMMTGLTAYTPDANRKQEMYRAGTLRVAHEMMKPTSAAPMQAVICQVRSFRLPEERATRNPARAETGYGGQVKTAVMILEKPRLSTKVGKKLLKLQALRCMFCIKHSR